MDIKVKRFLSQLDKVLLQFIQQKSLRNLQLCLSQIMFQSLFKRAQTSAVFVEIETMLNKVKILRVAGLTVFEPTCDQSKWKVSNC